MMMNPKNLITLLLGLMALPLVTRAQETRPVQIPYMLQAVGTVLNGELRATVPLAELAPVLQTRLRPVFGGAEPVATAFQLEDAGPRGYFLRAEVGLGGTVYAARLSLISREGQVYLPETGQIEVCAGHLRADGPGCDCGGLSPAECGYQLYYDLP
ncbi:MAG: hypothetical protein D6722_24215 [Bacteroidetes bacterium]|nr:MAG: hypothetical protein D6722_24215 [Bacteroidota bacterium]